MNKTTKFLRLIVKLYPGVHRETLARYVHRETLARYVSSFDCETLARYVLYKEKL